MNSIPPMPKDDRSRSGSFRGMGESLEENNRQQEVERQQAREAARLEITDLTPPMHRQDSMHPMEAPDMNENRLTSRLADSVARETTEMKEMRSAMSVLVKAVESLDEDGSLASALKPIRQMLGLPDSAGGDAERKAALDPIRLADKDDRSRSGSFRGMGESLEENTRQREKEAEKKERPANIKDEDPGIYNGADVLREIMFWRQEMEEGFSVLGTPLLFKVVACRYWKNGSIIAPTGGAPSGAELLPTWDYVRLTSE